MTKSLVGFKSIMMIVLIIIYMLFNPMTHLSVSMASSPEIDAAQVDAAISAAEDIMFQSGSVNSDKYADADKHILTAIEKRDAGDFEGALREVADAMKILKTPEK